MKMYLKTAVLLLVATAWSAPDDYDDFVAAQPKLLRVSGIFDGTGRIVFTRAAVRYEHKHWGTPSRLVFDGEGWADFGRTPAAWLDYADRLDLTRARIVRRDGRDTIALEHTPDGFDLYVCDSPNGGAEYAITLAIPRRR